MKNYRPTPTGGSGQAQAASYDMLGAYAILIELWGSPTQFADLDDDGRVSDEEMIKWIDIDLQGEGWIDPYRFNHPDLGEIWLGGTPRKHVRRTPPARYVEQEAERNALFVLYCASQFPKVEFTDVKVTPAAHDLGGGHQRQGIPHGLGPRPQAQARAQGQDHRERLQERLCDRSTQGQGHHRPQQHQPPDGDDR